MNKLIKFIGICILSVSSINVYAVLSCPVTEQVVLEWETLNWPDPTNIDGNAAYNPTLSDTFNVGGVGFDFDFTASGPANFLASLENVSGVNVDGQVVAAPNDYSGAVGPGDLSGDSVPDQGLAMVVNPLTDFDVNGGVPSVLNVALDVTFSEVLSEFEFTIADIDQSNDRRDQVTITASYLGVTRYPTLSVNPSAQGASFTIGGINNNVATADAAPGNAVPDGPNGTGDGTPGNERDPADSTVFATFTQPIDSIRIVYGSFNDGVGGRGITMFGDFTFCPGYNVSGTVFEDSDASGTFTASDPVIGGATVQIFADDGAGNPTGPAIDTQTTAADGTYTFLDVAPGDFIIVETDPVGFASAADIVGANDNQIPLTITALDVTGQDFLDIRSTDVSITKTDGSATYTPGGAFSYTILVSNNGLSDADGSRVIDAIPGWAVNPTWACGSETGGAACANATGTGSIDELIPTFPSSSSVTFTISGIYSSNMADY